MSPKRLFAALALLLASLAGVAATTADRSPFFQGIWWNGSRPGHGFDIFSVGNDVSLLWYTYDAAGRATWYSAQGALDGSSTASLPLQEHRWVGGQHSPSTTTVGSIRLDITNAELMTAAWTLGTTQGTWAIRPFTTAGIISEVDHSGTWFNPQASGWGLSFLEQGDVTGGILFTYDAAGLPTWYSGFGRDRGSVEMSAFTGACPSCTSTAATSRSVGRLGYDFTQEWQMTLHSTISQPMAVGVDVEGAKVFQLGRPASQRTADRTLVTFANEAALKAYIVGGYGNIYNPGAVGFSASPAPVAFSATNLQEAGVDEADLVKTDGEFIYTYAHGTGGNRIPAIRIARAGTDGTSLAVRGTYPLASGTSTPIGNAGLYLSGQALVSITGSEPALFSPAWFGSGSFSGSVTNVEIMSLATPDAPTTRWRAEIEGYVLSSRRIGERLYVVSRFVPQLGMTPSAVPVSQLLPKVRVNGGEATTLVDASSIYSPPQGERATVADMIVVTAIDLVQPRVVQSLAVIGMAEAVYASPQNLYIATTRSSYRSGTGFLLPVEPIMVTTDLHQVQLGAGGMRVVGSGSIEGFLGSDIDKAAFRLSEHNGQLRAVSSSSGMWIGTKNRLTVLEASSVMPGLLKTVSVLPNAQRPEAIGKPGEQLYATRFLDDRLYAVTFRNVDPLYVIDLSNGADPKIAGALELPGFSEYLHPLPGGLLLGFGKDACPVNVTGDGQFAWYQGLSLTLFDVSNANQPRTVKQMTFGKRGSSSALLQSHHAFSSLVQADGSTTIAIPARIHDGSPSGGGIVGGGTAECNNTSYAWTESGLMRFNVKGTGASAQLTQLTGLRTHSASTPSTMPYPDPGSNGGRSIVFRSGTVYVGGGQFWHQDSMGFSFGPY